MTDNYRKQLNKKRWKYDEDKDTLQRGISVQIKVLSDIKNILLGIGLLLALILIIIICAYVLGAYGVL